MKLIYNKDTDSLHMDLIGKAGADSEGVGNGHVVGFDLQHASERIDLARLETASFPGPGGKLSCPTCRPADEGTEAVIDWSF